ncbi:hypothetical protein QR680_016539 [Steinernema hermaphroditum]|uniref:Uncharacterized protein n=1 Tax=Steinernema hermaphroditum TaxID=289476 RepID=A0AA39LMT9_9BILA|nr:hypothetical protein QR680_016539 [Steinernema hermaphroditum]
MLKLRGAVGVGLAIGVVTVGSTLFYLYYVDRQRRRRQRKSFRQVNSTTLESERSVECKIVHCEGQQLYRKRTEEAQQQEEEGMGISVYHVMMGNFQNDASKGRHDWLPNWFRSKAKPDKDAVYDDHPPVVHTSLMSCDCRSGKNNEQDPDDTEALEPEDANAELLTPQFQPLSFEKYKPIDLTKLSPENEKKNLSLAALKDRNPAKTNILTPFRPTVNAIAYGSKHAKLIKNLIDNYQRIEK